MIRVYDTTVWVSIHVPARGTTVSISDNALKSKVSIHVPARGTTRTDSLSDLPNRGFNPRSREGNDNVINSNLYKFTRFQSTFPRGERQQAQWAMEKLPGFNPRSREGNDGSETAIPVQDIEVSIHVPARGTTAITYNFHL